MSYGFQLFDESGLKYFDLDWPVFKLISKTTHTIPSSGGALRDFTVAAPGASSAANKRIATVFSLPYSQRIPNFYDHEAFLRSVNTDSVTFRLANYATATLTIYVFEL